MAQIPEVVGKHGGAHTAGHLDPVSITEIRREFRVEVNTKRSSLRFQEVCELAALEQLIHVVLLLCLGDSFVANSPIEYIKVPEEQKHQSDFC